MVSFRPSELMETEYLTQLQFQPVPDLGLTYIQEFVSQYQKGKLSQGLSSYPQGKWGNLSNKTLSLST